MPKTMWKNIVIGLLGLLLLMMGWRHYVQIGALKEKELAMADCRDAAATMPVADSLLWIGEGDAARQLFAAGQGREAHLRHLAFWESRLEIHRQRMDSILQLRDAVAELALRQRQGNLALQRRLTQLNAGLEQEEEKGRDMEDSLRRARERFALDSLIRETKEKDMRAMVDSLRTVIGELEVRLANRKYLQWVSPKGVDIIYIGDTDGERPHGQGTGIWKNGTYYEGNWEQGDKHGRGVYQFPQGERYEGEFVRNQREGHGTYLWKNGDVYSGGWKNDLREGEGVIRDKDGRIVKRGIWKADKVIQSVEVPEGH